MKKQWKSNLIVIIQVFILVFLLVSGMVKREQQEQLVKTTKQEADRVCVVLDAGHGGIDPGKIGVNEEKEKDINLAIAKKVKEYLEQQDIDVIMTRESDEGLYQFTDQNKKIVDMKKRLEIIETNEPVIAVSIHQNSYPDASVSGMQVFYYRDSVSGKDAAGIMQQQLIQTLHPQKEREAKENTTYYLLKKTSVPIVIVECGFLSNPTESGLLQTESYQNRVAWAIHLGILRYVNIESTLI